MIFSIALFGALNATCGAPTIQNFTNIWNKQDQATYEGAIKRCIQLYPTSPCLKTFIKKDSTTYNAVCGEK